jgi:hypothetical protein
LNIVAELPGFLRVEKSLCPGVVQWLPVALLAFLDDLFAELMARARSAGVIGRSGMYDWPISMANFSAFSCGEILSVRNVVVS